MTNLQHRVGVNEVNLVRRKLKLANTNESKQTALLTEIDNTFGVDELSFNTESKILSVAYDATHCNLEIIEKIMARYGVTVADTWWNRFKVSYYKFVDQNLKDNANHQATCCHQVPPGASKKGK